MAERESIHLHSFSTTWLDGCVALARTFGWPSYADPETARIAYTAPGCLTWIAAEGDLVVGIAHLMTNGRVHAHLSLVGVLPEYRRRGVAKDLIRAAFEQSGAKWLDLRSDPEAEEFYRSYPHQQHAGFRIYPLERTE